MPDRGMREDARHEREALKERVFLSYSSRDRGFVRKFELLIRAAGSAGLWRDARSLEHGANWRLEVVRAIDCCDRMLVFWCCHARASHHVEAEYSRASSSGKTVVPVILVVWIWMLVDALVGARVTLDLPAHKAAIAATLGWFGYLAVTAALGPLAPAIAGFSSSLAGLLTPEILFGMGLALFSIAVATLAAKHVLQLLAAWLLRKRLMEPREIASTASWTERPIRSR